MSLRCKACDKLLDTKDPDYCSRCIKLIKQFDDEYDIINTLIESDVEVVNEVVSKVR